MGTKTGTKSKQQLCIEYIPLAQLQRWPRNPKAHDLGALHQSIGRFGFVSPILIDERSGQMVAGHGRVDTLAQMKAEGQSPPARVEANGKDWLVPVIRGVSFTSDTEAEAYGVADNRHVELGGWDDPKLVELLKDLADADALEGTGFDGDDIDQLMADLEREAGGNGEEDPGAQIDKAEELNEKWGVKLGDLWLIPSKTVKGKAHRVMCGDFLISPDLTRLLGDATVGLILTDPPYGIGVIRGSSIGGGGPVGGKKNRGSIGGGKIVRPGLYEPIVGDDKPFDPAPLLVVGENQVIFGANYFASKLPDSRGWFVWDKIEGMEGTTQNFSDFEMGWTSFDRPARLFRHRWQGLMKGSERDQKRCHPTQKPVALIADLLRYYGERQPGPVCDPFLGSGTTVVAAEQLGRLCFGMEIEPKYVAVTLERLSGMGLEPERA